MTVWVSNTILSFAYIHFPSWEFVLTFLTTAQEEIVSMVKRNSVWKQALPCFPLSEWSNPCRMANTLTVSILKNVAASKQVHTSNCRAQMRSQSFTNNDLQVQISFQVEKHRAEEKHWQSAPASGETIVLIKVFYGFIHRLEYEQIFPVNKQRCGHRSVLTSRSEMAASLFVFDPGKMRTIKKKKKGVYTVADTNQGTHLHLEMRNTGKQIQQVPTWTQAERNKTDVSVRNTLSQLHWLRRSVNTQYRQALIENIWWVWIYKNQTKIPPASAPSNACVCVHCMTMPCLRFLSVHSLTPGRWMLSEASQATVAEKLPRPHLSSLGC